MESFSHRSDRIDFYYTPRDIFQLARSITVFLTRVGEFSICLILNMRNFLVIEKNLRKFAGELFRIEAWYFSGKHNKRVANIREIYLILDY